MSTSPTVNFINTETVEADEIGFKVHCLLFQHIIAC